MDLNPAIAMAMLNIVTECKVSFRRLDWIRIQDQPTRHSLKNEWAADTVVNGHHPYGS